MSEEKQPPRFSKAFSLLAEFCEAEARGETEKESGRGTDASS